MAGGGHGNATYPSDCFDEMFQKQEKLLLHVLDYFRSSSMSKISIPRNRGSGLQPATGLNPRQRQRKYKPDLSAMLSDLENWLGGNPYLKDEARTEYLTEQPEAGKVPNTISLVLLRYGLQAVWPGTRHRSCC